MPCRHTDIRKFDGVRCCMACGEAVFETPTEKVSSSPKPSRGEEYEYVDLNLELGQEIRLVAVMPGKSTDKLVCEIIHVNLADFPEYEAVSYTWATEEGDMEKSCTISGVHGEILRVTVNCDLALRQLRRPGLKRLLWIDSLCINQSHVKERNHQVGLMDQIFSRASRVLMCIQDPNYSYSGLFRWLREGYGDDEEMNASYMWATKRLFSLRYFSRVWVIQEVALANAAFLLVNNESILLSNNVLQRLWGYCVERELKIPGSLQWVPGESHQTDIVPWLGCAMGCESTDPRDKVYAILSMLDWRTRSVIPIDYSLKVESVYANAFAAVIASQQSLELLSEFGLEDSDPNSVALTKEEFHDYFASKTRIAALLEPDDDDLHIQSEIQLKPRKNQNVTQFAQDTEGPWRSRIEVKTTNKMSFPAPEGLIKKAANVSQVLIEVSSEDDQHPRLDVLPRIQVTAHFIDVVSQHWKHVSPSASSFAENILEESTQLFHVEYSWILPFFRRSGPQYINPANSWTCGDRIPLEEVDPDDAPDYNLPDMIQFLEIAESMADERCMLQTYHSLGFAFPGFREGDEIFAIDGARTPFILRRTKDQCYRVITDCYLWGALNLDYWTPGSKIGRWGAGRHEHIRRQTQIIEIH